MPIINQQQQKIYNANEINLISEACKVAVYALMKIKSFIKPGVSTLFLDDLCNDFILEKNGRSACKGYKMQYNSPAYPRYTCISVNSCLCHGIPSEKVILKKGDIINIDITVEKNGFFGDTSRMYIVGDTNQKNKDLIQHTQNAMMEGINIISTDNYIEDIGAAVEKYIQRNTSYYIVQEYVGHGIGSVFHGVPNVFHYNTHKKEIKIENGMCFTVEPIIQERKSRNFITSEGWQVFARDQVLSAQYEHTVVVENNKYRILTNDFDVD